MAERRVATKSRRLGSSRRQQLRQGSSQPAASSHEPATSSHEPPWASEPGQKDQDLLREQAKEQAGFVTRSELQLQEEALPCSREEPELGFAGLDTAGSGRMSSQEFTAGLRQLPSSQQAAREHRRRKTASRRGHLQLPSPGLQGMDSEHRRHFTAFLDQLGMDISEGQEIWQLWENLQKDEPQLLGNLEDFLAKLKHHIQEARSKKEALEVTLSKYKAEHGQEVQQLSEPQEQQSQQGQQQLQQESMPRSPQQGMELQPALDASEREVQKELETQCHSLHSMNQATSPGKQQLEESSQVLEKDLQHLQTHRHLQITRDRVVAEVPSRTPVSPQTSLEKSKKNLSKMQLRLGSQSDEPKAKSSHQVAWEVLPAEMSLLGVPPRASSTGEDPFPELLKEEHFSDQSSLLREMNDAIAALSKQLKPQALAAPPDSVHHPWEPAEPQAGPEEATAPSTSPTGLQETVPGHVDHKLLEGGLREEGAATAEHPAPDGMQAGGSVGAGHCRAQELGTEQGESPEEAQRMLFPQAKGTAVKKLMVKVAERMEAGEPAQVQVQGEGWMQEKAGWEKAEPLGEAKGEALSQGEAVEAGLGPAGLAAAWQLAMEQLQLAAAPAEHSQPLGMGLGQEAEMPSGTSKKLELKLGEHLEPEPPRQGEAQVEAAQEDSVLPKVPVAPGPGMLGGEHAGVQLHPQGQTLAADVPQAQHGGSSRARAEEEEMEVRQPKEAGPQLQDESGRGDAAVGGGSLGTEVSLPAALPPANGQEGGGGTDVQALETQSRAAKGQLLAKVEADLQPPAEASYPGTQQGGSVAPGGQEEPEGELEEEMGAAAVHGEGPSPAETAVRSPGLAGLLPVQAQELALEEAEDAQAERQLSGDLSPETPRGEEGGSTTELMEEAEDGRQGQLEHELPQEPLLDLQAVTIRQGEGAGAGVQAWEETLILGTLQDQSTDAHVQLSAEPEELKETPEESTEAELQPLSASMGTGQGWSMAPDVQGLAQAAKAELAEREAEDGQAERQLGECASPEAPQAGESGSAIQLEEEAEGQRQEECELLQEPVPDLCAAGAGQGEGQGVTLGTLGDQSTDAHVQLSAVTDKLKLSPGGSLEAGVQLSSEATCLGTEQGWSMAPDVQGLAQAAKAELVEMMEAEDGQAERQLGEGLSPKGREGGSAMQLKEEAEDGALGQSECELLQQPVLHCHAVTIRQGEGAGAGVQPLEETLILGTLENQGTGANVQLSAEIEELTSASGGSKEIGLQPLSEGGYLGTGQGWSMAPDVQGLDEAAKAELVEMMEAEDGQAERQLGECASPEAPQAGESGSAIQLEEEAEGQRQEECELLQEPGLDLHGAGLRQGEGAGPEMPSWQEDVILGTLEEQSTGANVQLSAEPEELRSTSGGSKETDVQGGSEAGSLDTGQGWSMAPGVQGLDQAAKAELVQREAEDGQAERQLGECASPEAPQVGESGSAIQLEEEAEGQRQEECELLQEPVLDLCAAGAGQGEGAGAGVQPLEEDVILGTLEDQSTGANVQLSAGPEELKSTSGGSMQADLTPLGTAGMWEGKQRHSAASEAALCALPSTEVWAEAAGAHVPPLAEATPQPGHAAASEGPGLETTLGSFPDPAGQILEDTQALGIAQGKRSAARERPVDGAQGLEVVQLERLEAGERSLVAAQSLELHQGHDDDEVSVVASLLSEVASELSTAKLGTLMQEDVLIPDVWCLGAWGQAAPGELLEQGSAQAVKVRPHSASQQLQEKPAHVMETEQVSARPAEHPEEEMPPASTLQTGVQQKEDTGSDQPGMVLRDTSLGEAAQSSLQLQRQLLGEQSNDLRGGQWKGKQEAGQKMSQEGKPSPGTSGAAPRSSEASLGPDHLYNVLFVGDSHVGKTSFLHRLHADTFSPHLTATVGLDYQVKNLLVDNKSFALRLWDSAGQERYRSLTKQFFRRADGVVLMYDLTSQQSFSDVTYWLSCIQEGAGDGVTILLLGNKTDCAAERQVPTKEGELLAKEHQLLFYECSAASGHNVSESMVSLARLLKVREDELKQKEEGVSQAPQKKKSCCW